jgi:hypothetical protein
MKNGKTPYEIRLDLLELAYRIVRGQKEAECAAEAVAPTALITKAPTTDEVLAEAEKLNGFVSQSTEGK